MYILKNMILFSMLLSCVSAISQPMTINISDRQGGVVVGFNETRWGPPVGHITVPTFEGSVYFGGIPGENAGFVPFQFDSDTAEPTHWRMEAIAPVAERPGPVDVLVQTVVGGISKDYLYPDGFTYVDSPIVDSFTPANRSIGPDNRRMFFLGSGFPLRRKLEFWIGDQRATDIYIEPPYMANLPGTRVTCTPPPFPGGEYPLTVDVRVVTVGGGETVLPGAITYQQIIPYVHLLATEFSAWTAIPQLVIEVRNVLNAPGMRVFFGEVEATVTCVGSECAESTGVEIRCFVPPHRPSEVNVTVVNPDGGTSTLPDAFLFYRTSPYHAADTDADGRLTLRELLRVVQFFNSSGYQCAPEGVETEDGYALGLPADAGAQECIPHDGDLETQNWQVELTELLDVIQVYAFGQYEVCEDRYQFCPAAEEGEGELSTTDEHR